MLSVTKRFKFCYGHSLPDYNGPCRFMHGHNGVVEVEIATPIYDADSLLVHCVGERQYRGMVIDFSELKETVGHFLDTQFDHHFVTEEECEGQPPTAEVMCLKIVRFLKGKYGDNLVRVRFYETDDSYAEWKKES